MSSTIIGKVMAMRMKNGKMLPFVLRAESNVRTFGNAYDWRWQNIYVGKHSNFMFVSTDEVQATIKSWAESGSVKYRNGGFITLKGMNRLLARAFANPIPFKSGLLRVDYLKLSEDRTRAERVTFIPKTEEDLLSYMEENKDRSCYISMEG